MVNKVNRTGEIVLTAFGMMASLLGVVVIILLNKGLSDPFIVEEMREQLVIDGLPADQIDLIFHSLSISIVYFMIVPIVSLIVGGIAFFLLIGDKKPRAAGILLIISAAIILLASVFMSFFASLFYIIAGIMALVRKRKEEVLEEDMISENG